MDASTTNSYLDPALADTRAECERLRAELDEIKAQLSEAQQWQKHHDEIERRGGRIVMPKCSCGADLAYVEQGIWACECAKPPARTLLSALNTANRDMVDCLGERNALRVELAEIRARTCEHCRQWRVLRPPARGECGLHRDAEMRSQRYATDYCSRWEARDALR